MLFAQKIDESADLVFGVLHVPDLDEDDSAQSECAWCEVDKTTRTGRARYAACVNEREENPDIFAIKLIAHHIGWK